MLSGFFGKNKQKKKSQRKKSKRRTKKNRTLEEKKAEWTSRWGSDDYEPFWDLKEMPESIIELIQKGTIPHGVKIVDIGCGSGYLSAHLAERDFQVTGFDFAPTAIDRAKKNYPEIPHKLKFVTADATKALPFEDIFQVGIDRGTFHTLPNRNRADYVAAISPIVEEGGCLIMMYALRIAKKLIESSEDDPAVLLKEHLAKVFARYFELEDFRPIFMASHDEKDTPGFLIVFRKKSNE